MPPADVILAVDPGTTQSAYVVLNHGWPYRWGLDDNDVMRRHVEDAQSWGVGTIVVEMIASYGMAVGAEVFETCVWIGRFLETARRCNIADQHRIKRMDVKHHLCHSSRANDSNIRQAIINRFGGKDKAVGSKKEPGPLHGMKADIWQALAVGLTHWDQLPRPPLDRPHRST